MVSGIGILQGRDKIRPVVVICLVVAFFSVVSVAKADTANVYFIGATGSITLNVSDPDSFPGSVTAYIDPYIGTINGASSPTLIFCIDPDHGVSPKDSWTAYVSYPGDLSKTFLGTTKAYGEMAWLARQLQAAGNTPFIKQELQAAIWDIAEGATPSTPTSTGDFKVGPPAGDSNFDNNVAKDISNAQQNALTSGFEILTDKATVGTKQEYLVLTPEPSTLLLLAVGLFALLMVSRSKPLVFKA
jgi:hypothetical protein